MTSVSPIRHGCVACSCCTRARPHEIICSVNLIHRRPKLIFFWSIYGVVALAVMTDFLLHSGVNLNPLARLESMMDGSANRPFVYRALVPALVSAVNAVTPEPVIEAIERSLGQGPVSARLMRNFLQEEGRAYPALWAILLMFGSLAGYGVLLHRLAQRLFADSPIVAWISPLLGLVIIPAFARQGYIYDFPQLFLFTLCLYLMAGRNWLAFLLAFGVTCFNKETTVLILMTYLLYYRGKLSRRNFVGYGLAQLAIFAAVKMVLSWWYAHNPGDDMELWFFIHLMFLKRDLLHPAVPVLVGGLALSAYRWHAKPEFLRCGLWLFVPFTVLYLMGGFPGEYRVFYEVLPILVLLTTASAVELAGVKTSG